MMSRNSQFLCLCAVFSAFLWVSSTFLTPNRTGISSRFKPNSRSSIRPRILFNLDAPLDYLPPQTLTAILPILPSTVGQVQDLLQPFLANAIEQLSEIIIVCPQSAALDIRRQLRGTFASFSADSDLDVSLWPWQSPMNANEAVLSCATQVTTEWILVMDEKGLKGVTESVRAALLRPPNVTLPLGPAGVKQDSYIPISSQWGLLQPAQYLYPPFILPSTISRSFKFNGDPPSLLWIGLGSHIARFRADGIGGLRLHAAGLDGSTALPSSSSTIAQIGHSLLPTTDDLDAPGNWKEAPLSEEDLDQTESLQPTTTPLPDTLKTITTDFVFFLPTLVDLDKVSFLVCRLLENTTRPQIRILIYDGLHPSPHQLGWKSGTFENDNDNCAIDYDILTGTQPLSFSAAGSTILANWLDKRHRATRIVFMLKELDLLVSFMNSHGKTLLPGATFISVPRADLEHTDWMSSLTITEWQHWHNPKVDLSVITRDRPTSLLRLLKSLSGARYFGDHVDLRINIEQDCDEETLMIAHDFDWQHGSALLHHRVVHGGLLPAVVEAWYPKNDDCYGVLLEDDVEVSPLFYAWIKMTLLRYRYGDQSNWKPYIFGISLYQQKHLELPQDGRQAFNPRLLFSSSGGTITSNPITPYLSQVPCSWGAVYFPEHWKEFHAYLAYRLTESIIPIETQIVSDVRSNHWTRSWKRFFIELVYLRGYVMLYPNFEDFISLSTNHLEVGSHVKVRSPEKQEIFLLPLMQLPKQRRTSPLLDMPDGKLPMLEELPILNLTGFVTSFEGLQDQGSLTRFELFGCDSSSVLYDVLSLMCIQD